MTKAQRQASEIESRIVVISPTLHTVHAPGTIATATKYDDLPVATEEQSREYLDIGRRFVDANNTQHYAHARGVAATAIADYIASTHGVQLLWFVTEDLPAERPRQGMGEGWGRDGGHPSIGGGGGGKILLKGTEQ